MKSVSKVLNHYFLHSNSWIYVVLFLIMSHVEVRNDELSLINYVLNIGILISVFSPLLLLEIFKKPIQKSWKNNRFFTLSYFSIQVLYLLIINNLNVAFDNGNLIPFQEGLLALTSLYCVLIGIGIELFEYAKSKINWFNLIRKVSLDKAFIIILFLIAGIIASIIVSNKEDFFNHQTLSVTTDFKLLIRFFPLFLAIWFQLFLTYMAGYFFYYANAHFLIPKLLRQRGILYYIMGALGTIFIFYPLLGFIIYNFPLHQEIPVLLPSENYDVLDSKNSAIAMGIIIISLPVTLAIEWFKQNNDIVNLEKQQIETELDLLKQQINPHFFFNTLNNLYALSLTKSSKTPEVIMQLSELMRYVIYKGKEASVPLKEEVKYIEDYINLQQLRIHKTIDLTFTKELKSPGLPISPLMLIILVENAFKHGIEPSEQKSKLHIEIKSDEHQMHFKCINSYENIGNIEGIGLKNLKRRLQILYPDRHELSLVNEDNTFTANLKLALK